MSRDVVRWLLRVLVEPSFLRYYCFDTELPLLLPTVEAELFALPVDSERPEAARREAWQRLRGWLPPSVGAPGDPAPAQWFRAILLGLRSTGELASHARELSRFWAVPELFLEPVEDCPPPRGDDLPPYHELHCHFRGGVPFLSMWQKHLHDARARAALRRAPLLAGRDSRTWAELLERVIPARVAQEPALGENEELDEGAARGRLRARVLAIREDTTALPALREHVRYVAACAGLASYLLHQRQQGALTKFVESYERYSKLQKGGGLSEELQTRDLVGSLLRRFEAEGAVAIELRPTLDASRADLQRKLRGLARGYLEYVRQSSAPIAMGLVPSLFKQELLNPCHPPPREIWRTQQEHWERQVEMLLEVLGCDPLLRWLTVGLDAAGQERGCPPGVLRPAFDLVHRYNQGAQYARPGRMMDPQALRELLRSDLDGDVLQVLSRQPWAPQRIRLGITVHAGEDFEDPVTGLRHIWESVELLGLTEGDRIGHGLAASLAPSLLDEWKRRRFARDGETPRVNKPRGTHLLDLSWISHVAHPAVGDEARAQLAEVATRAFGAPASFEWLQEELRAAECIPRVAVPAARYAAPDGVSACDLEPQVLDERWQTRFESLRQIVVRLLVRKRIVVESCPTSNLVVANLATPPLRKLLDEPSLKVVVATDDPGLLNSYPRAELQHVPEAKRAGVLRQAAASAFVWTPHSRAVI